MELGGRNKMIKNHNQKLWDLCFETTSEMVINEVNNLIDHRIESETKEYVKLNEEYGERIINPRGEYQLKKLKHLQECISELVSEEVKGFKYYHYPFGDLNMEKDDEIYESEVN